MPVFTTFFLNDCMYTPYDLFCIIVCLSCTEIFGLSEKTELELVKHINMPSLTL